MVLRNETLFGIPITVGDPDELLALARDKQTIHVIPRCVDMASHKPHAALAARRRRMPCEGCGEICWYDPESIVDPAATFLCGHCLMALDDKPDVGMVSSDMFEEMCRQASLMRRGRS